MSDSVRPHRLKPTRLSHPWDSLGKNTGVGHHFLLQYVKGKSESEVTQSCLTLSDPMDCSLPGSAVHGIFQARVLEWGAIAFSRSHATVHNYFILDIWSIKWFSRPDFKTIHIYIYNIHTYIYIHTHICFISDISYN